MTILGGWLFVRYADQEVCPSGGRDPSSTTVWQASSCHLPQAGHPKGWGRSVGGRASGSDVPPLLEVPRFSRVALAGSSWGMSVGSVSGAFWGPGRADAVQRWEDHVLQLQPISFTAVCEGNSTCSENEVCVRPGECRCRHGYFGANCDTSEHGARWGLGVGQFGGKK